MEEQIQEQLAEIKQNLAELKSDASTHATQEDLKKYYTKADIDKKQYISAIPKEYVQDHELETIIENWDAQLNLESYATKDYVNQQIDNIEFPTYTPPTVEANVSYASQVSGDNTYVLGILTSGSNQYPIVGLKFTESGGGTGGGEIEIPEPEPAISPIFIFSAKSTLNRNHEGIPTEWSTNIASVTARPVYMSTARQKGDEYLRWDDGYVWTEPIQIIAANIVPESKPSSPNTVVLTEDEFNELKESGTLTPNTLYIIKDNDGNILYMVTTDSDGNILTTVKILTPQAQPLSEKITLEKWNELKANGELDRNKIYIVTSDDGSVVYGIGVATVLTKIPEPNPTPEMPDVLSEITKIFSQHATFDEDGKLQTLKWSIMDSSVPGEWYASTGFRNAVSELISTAGFVSTADLESATSEMYAYVDDISATITAEIIDNKSFVKAVADEIDLTANETIRAQAQRITDAESNISALTITTNKISSSVQNISDGIVKASTIDQTDNSITLSVMQADETGETSASVGILKLYNDPDNDSRFYLAADHVKFEAEDYENIAKHVTVKAEDINLQGLVNAQDTLTVGGGSSVFNKSGSGWVASKGIQWDNQGIMTVTDMYGTGNTIPGQTYITADNFDYYFYQSDIDKNKPIDGKQVYVPRLDRLGRVIIIQSLPDSFKLVRGGITYYGLIIAFPHIGYLGKKNGTNIWSMRTGMLNMQQLYALDGLSYTVIAQDPYCWVECAYGKIYTTDNDYIFNYERTDSFPGSIYGLKYTTYSYADSVYGGRGFEYNVFPELVYSAINITADSDSVSAGDAIPTAYIDNGSINEPISDTTIQPIIPDSTPEPTVIEINITSAGKAGGAIVDGVATQRFNGTCSWQSNSPLAVDRYISTDNGYILAWNNSTKESEQIPLGDKLSMICHIVANNSTYGTGTIELVIDYRFKFNTKYDRFLLYLTKSTGLSAGETDNIKYVANIN